MNETNLFDFLETQAASVLLGLLRTAYDQMDRDQRQEVFGRLITTLPPAPVDGEALLDEVEDFRRESMAGVYYAPFKINSKNWSHIPDETREWFDSRPAPNSLRKATTCTPLLVSALSTRSLRPWRTARRSCSATRSAAG